MSEIIIAEWKLLFVLHLMFMLSISVALVCVIRVGLVIVGQMSLLKNVSNSSEVELGL